MIAKMNVYRCDICGCYLDPGEGRICEECRAEDRRKQKEKREIFDLMKSISKEQYEEWLNESV